MTKPYDSLSAIIEYEQGDLSEDKTIELFQYLVDTGMAWTLQGSYGRMAHAMLQAGIIKPANRLDSKSKGGHGA